MAGLTPNYLPKQMKPQQSFMPTTANRSAPVGRARHARTALPVLAAMVMAIVSVVVLTLAGCASSAGIAPTAQSVAPADIGLDSGAAPMAGPAPAADWWRAFGDAELNGLIERALAGNPSLKVAQARLARAEAAASGAQAAGGPQVDGSLDITRERFSATSIYPPPLGGSIRTLGTAQISASWEIDFFGRNRAAIGLATAPVGILAILLSPWVGKNVSKVDPRKLATVAFVGFGLVLWMRSHFNVQADFMTILIPTVLQGAAMAFFFIPLQAIVFSGLPPERMSSAAGLSNFVRITAGAVGTSLFTTFWENRAILHHAQLSEAVNAGNPAAVQTLGQLTAGGLSTQQALASINGTIDQQAYTMAVNDMFYLSGLLFFVLIGVIWLAKPQPGGAPGGGGAH
jgi:Outer membrane efflux protein